MFSVRSNRSTFLFNALLMISLGGVGFYTFTIFKGECGMNATTSMLLVMVAQFPTMMGTAYWGPISDEAAGERADGRIQTLLRGALQATVFSAPAYAVLPLFRIGPSYLLLYIVFAAVAAWANDQALLPIMDVIVSDTNPPEVRSITASVRYLIGVLTGSIGIVVIGATQAAQGSFTWATIIFSTIGAFSALALLPDRRHVPSDMEALDKLMVERASELAAHQMA